jgi:hypothetical protein
MIAMDSVSLRVLGENGSAMKARIALIVPLAGYAIFISESVFARPNPKWALLLLLWALGAAILAWWLACGKAGCILDSLDRHASRVAMGMIVAAALVLVAVSVWQARYFALSVHAEDTAYYNQLLWNTLHGDFLSGNVQQERLYKPPVSNDLALHVSPILLVGLLPIYLIFPHFLTLLILRDVALAAAAWPLFLLARDRMGGTGGVVAVLLYLSNPAVIAQSFEAFYLLQLAPLPFFWALHAFVRKEFGKFLCWVGVAIGMREDVAITMAGFGLWALIRKRQFRWSTVGLGVPIVWWGLATLIIQPFFGRWGNSAFDVALAGGKHSQLGIYQILLGNPAWILDGLRAGGLEYLYRSLRSVGFLGVLGWEWLLSAPILAANLFLGRVFYSGSDPLSRFALMGSCTLIGASIVIVSRIGRNRRLDMRVFAVIMLLFLPSASLLDGIKDAVQARLALYTVHNDAALLWEAIERIPADASVAAPNYALPALSKRQKLFYITYLYMYPQAQPNYILLDRNINRITVNPELQRHYVTLLNELSQSTDYESVWQRGDYFLLQRRQRSISTT